MADQLCALGESLESWADYLKWLGEQGLELSPIGDIITIADGIPQIGQALIDIGNAMSAYIRDAQDAYVNSIDRLFRENGLGPVSR